MTEPEKSPESLEKQYAEKLPLYEQMGKNLLNALGTILMRSGVEIYGLSYRVKDFASFKDKVEREKLDKPFEQCSDLCGLRIVNYHKSDLQKIGQIIAQVMEVTAGGDMNGALRTDTFGYRALQFIVKLRPETLQTPEFAGMEGMLAEIQVRTAVMDTWANIMGKLVYEKKEHIPVNFQRKFYQLNAFFDLADDTFDELMREKEKYAVELNRKTQESGEFNSDLPMNLDNLQAFLDSYFPKRKKNLKVVGWLLVNVITPHNTTMEELTSAYENIKAYLPAIEKELSVLMKETYFFKETEFERTQGIMLMTILSLNSDDYWLMVSNLFDERYWEKLLQFFHKWRGKIQS